VSQKGKKFSIMMPQWEKVAQTEIEQPSSTDQHLHTGRLVPVYPETYGITSKWLRTKIDDLFPKVKSQIQDPIPPELLNQRLPFNPSSRADPLSSRSQIC
jgi:RecG-like helicase